MKTDELTPRDRRRALFTPNTAPMKCKNCPMCLVSDRYGCVCAATFNTPIDADGATCAIGVREDGSGLVLDDYRVRDDAVANPRGFGRLTHRIDDSRYIEHAVDENIYGDGPTSDPVLERGRWAHRAYRRFQLIWMLDHGHTLHELIESLSDFDAGRDEPTSITDLFDDWVLDSGFNDEIWPCFEEWLGVEGLEIM